MTHIHTQIELSGLLQAAGASPEIQMEFNRRLVERPHLAAWLSVPRAEQDQILAERRARPAVNTGRRL